MNYRHAFHAGNHADCLKHAMLVAILHRLRRKETPFLVLDSHAGTGRTALDGPDAARTGEWRDGIGRLTGDTPAPLAPLLAALGAAGFDGRLYPGSPLIAAALLRPGDRLIACELHDQDADALRSNLAGTGAAVHRRDGYEAVHALLPPPSPHRRGLVLLDPPFEASDDWDRLAAAVATARRRFPGGVVAGWYPIKGRAAARAFHARLADRGIRDLHCFELLLREPVDAGRLDGSGLVVAAPPWGFADAAAPILGALRDRLAPTGAFRIEVLAGE